MFGRVYGFYHAFKYTRKDANIKTSGLIKFYETAIAEWKGLIALLALYPDRVRISEPIPLEHRNFDELFDISNAFGRI